MKDSLKRPPTFQLLSAYAMESWSTGSAILAPSTTAYNLSTPDYSRASRESLCLITPHAEFTNKDIGTNSNHSAPPKLSFDAANQIETFAAHQDATTFHPDIHTIRTISSSTRH